MPLEQFMNLNKTQAWFKTQACSIYSGQPIISIIAKRITDYIDTDIIAIYIGFVK